MHRPALAGPRPGAEEGCSRTDHVLEHHVSAGHGHLLPPKGVDELVAVAEVLEGVEALGRCGCAGVSGTASATHMIGRPSQQQLPSARVLAGSRTTSTRRTFSSAGEARSEHGRQAHGTNRAEDQLPAAQRRICSDAHHAHWVQHGRQQRATRALGPLRRCIAVLLAPLPLACRRRSARLRSSHHRPAWLSD